MLEFRNKFESWDFFSFPTLFRPFFCWPIPIPILIAREKPFIKFNYFLHSSPWASVSSRACCQFFLVITLWLPGKLNFRHGRRRQVLPCLVLNRLELNIFDCSFEINHINPLSFTALEMKGNLIIFLFHLTLSPSATFADAILEYGKAGELRKSF